MRKWFCNITLDELKRRCEIEAKIAESNRRRAEYELEILKSILSYHLRFKEMDKCEDAKKSGKGCSIWRK